MSSNPSFTDDEWQVRRDAVQFFAQTAPDDPKTKLALEKRLTDDVASVRLEARLALLQWTSEAPSSFLKETLDDFRKSSDRTSTEFDQRFAKGIGAAVAKRPELQEDLFEAVAEGLQHFDLASAITSAAETEDRERWLGPDETAD